MRNLEPFTALVLAEYEAILRTSFLIVGDRHQAEDVTQEAFTRLARHWRRVSTFDRPGAWVRRVAIRLAVRARAATPPDEPTAAVVVDDHAARHDVRAAVASLPAAQRAAVVLHYYEDRPTAEIAKILGCAEGTARVHLHRARIRLAALLNEELNDVAR